MDKITTIPPIYSVNDCGPVKTGHPTKNNVGINDHMKYLGVSQS